MHRSSSPPTSTARCSLRRNLRRAHQARDRHRRGGRRHRGVLHRAAAPRGCDPLAEAAGHHGVAICANGAVLGISHTESVLEASPLDPAIARELVALLEGEVPGGAWAVERAGGFGHEPEYVPRWPVPDGTKVDAVHALIAEPAVKLMLRHASLTADVLLERARADLRSPGRVQPLERHRHAARDQRRRRQQGNRARAALPAARHRAPRRDRLRRHAQRPADARLGRARGRGRQRTPGGPSAPPTRSPRPTTSPAWRACSSALFS